jgi:hypothetical protein
LDVRGVRLVLAGPPADIHAARAAAAECGLLDKQMTLVCDEVGPRVVFCGPCHTANTTLQPIGSEMDCQGCATALAITDHFSRRVGSYSDPGLGHVLAELPGSIAEYKGITRYRKAASAWLLA